MSFKLNIKNVEAVSKAFKTKPAEVQGVVQKHLDRFGVEAVNEAKRRCPVDEGFLRNSINFKSEPLKVSLIVGASYAAYLEFGTRTFAADYVNSLPADWQTFASQFKGKAGGNFDDFIIRLVEWVKRKGLHLTEAQHDAQTGERVGFHKVKKSKAQKEEDADIVAYLIAKSIMKKGIRAQPYLYPAVEIAGDALKKRIKQVK